MKNYRVKILFDNGVETIYETGKVSDEKMQEFISLPYTSFKEGKHGVLQLPNGYGSNDFIDITKVSKVGLIPLND
ncbi:hypothetical protein LCM23_13180 [Cytobacillus kochii]|uniref:hypothetical protein n=1 Tax=Cytobacillus kochii TaxID=859143 RepID=UPI001CD56F4B|nr:hypothetical protein [Cytobacillus kochii]MCA1027048.1 hypothetical protein [Cytobacillus kochii]